MRQTVILILSCFMLLAFPSCDDKKKQEAEYYSRKIQELEQQQYMNTSFGDPEHIGQVKGVDGKWYDANDNQAYVNDSTIGFKNEASSFEPAPGKKAPSKPRRHDDGM